ncbi:Transcriptional regulator protein PpsR [Beijerinckiaceae bacterium RH AL1]|nr:transcriptional regulator PpsR [Beijerinckiaceae bacterium]VVB43655.1 Transcriptional regulator protein PpsR [Beijerinckiaceae bacterium RH AL8]VVB43671.1 Transcriptional regulator protein PpsR [Beijerinckiaceae bacterium RH CH11]VVC53945.1 Transcriptional regulator protein PpsR [Beijerinckiaceae bacterium RH AL1]
MKAFRAPGDTIGALDAATAATLVATAADLALIMDRDGIIQDISFQQSDLSLELDGSGRWYGKAWSETVSLESQPKVDTLLKEATKNVASSWRQLTHQSGQGREVPILYATVRIGGGERIVALGRDLRAVAALQQRLIDAQMSMERDYAKLRFAETRYRLLFQTSAEPVVILDGGTHRIVEANPAAVALFETDARRTVGRPFAELFDAASRSRVQAFLGELRGAGRTDDIEATLAEGGETVVSASLYRQESATMLLVRLAPAARAPARLQRSAPDDKVVSFVEASPDGFVLADASGRILGANRTFVEMAQLIDPSAVEGAGLDRWLGRAGVDLDVIVANLKQHGSVRLFATVLRGEQGATLDVEVSAVALGQGRAQSFGFSIRDVGRRLAPPRQGGELPHSAEQLTELIGRVPLKDLVRETTDVIEKLCIEAALQLTGDNRASAAEMLGLSRQSLYVKLRRFGFADAAAADDEA